MYSSSNGPLKNFTQRLILTGCLFIVLGIAAFMTALVAPGLVGILLALFFLVGSVARLAYAFQTTNEKGFWLKLSIGILYLAASLVLFTSILHQLFALTSLLGTILILQGCLELFLAFRLAQGRARRWFLVTGIGALILGILFLNYLALGAAWLLGLLAAFGFIAPGVWFIFLAYSMQDPASPQDEPR
jgi:uncharacterized membrane protein HdeD (DUF308 family)